MNQAERRAFLERRRSGIGGSDVGALVGVHPFGKTATDVFLEKVRPLPETLPDPTPPMLRGIALEPIIGQMYAEKYDVTLYPAGNESSGHPLKPYIRASTDFILRDGEAMAGLEAKSLGIDTFAKLRAEGVIPQYQLQGQQQIMVLGLLYVDFMALSAERWQTIEARIEPDLQLQRDITAIEEQFWNDHVLKELPPTNDMFHLDLPSLGGKVEWIEDEERLTALKTLREAKELKKSVEAMEETAVATMKTLLGATGTYEAEGDFPGKVHRLVYGQQEGRWSFDVDALKADGALRPQLVQEIIIEQLGRYVEDPDAVTPLVLEALKESRINFDVAYQKRGASFTTLRIYPNAKRK